MSSLKFLFSLAVLLTFATGCPCVDAACNNGAGGGGGGTGGSGGGGGLALYEKFTLDTAECDRHYMELVTDPTRNRVGVVYISGKGEMPIIYGDDDAGLSGPVSDDGG